MITMARHVSVALCFQDLAVGDEWISPARTVTEADVVAFAGISGDFNAIHIDVEFSSRTPFRRPIAHGLLGMAISSGLTSQAPRVDTLAFLAILEWSFLEPIFFGDTIHVVTSVEALQERSQGRRGVVTWRRRLINQRDEVVQEGRTQTLVRGREPEARAEEDSSEISGP
jgi:acyl dehydratase